VFNKLSHFSRKKNFFQKGCLILILKNSSQIFEAYHASYNEGDGGGYIWVVTGEGRGQSLKGGL
jgi:hypothetical protein